MIGNLTAVTATGIGSLPGTDPLAAARLVVDALDDFPHLPELPARGPGAGMIGRGAALLVDLPVDLQPAGWRLVDRPGADQRRAVAFLRQDLDVLEEVFDGYEGLLKLQVAGPWTLAANLEKTRGDKVVADHGARRELAASYAEGVSGHVSEVARRVPGATVVLQLDEPTLPAVLGGGVPTMSGFGRLRSIGEQEAQTVLRAVVDQVQAQVVVHCCAPDVPLDLLVRTGASGIAIDLATFPTSRTQMSSLAQAVEAGVAVVAGVVPTLPSSATATEPPGSTRSMRDEVARLWQRLDQPADALVRSVIISPACGLAGASEPYARAALRRAREVAKALDDDPEVHRVDG